MVERVTKENQDDRLSRILKVKEEFDRITQIEHPTLWALVKSAPYEKNKSGINPIAAHGMRIENSIDDFLYKIQHHMEPSDQVEQIEESLRRFKIRFKVK